MDFLMKKIMKLIKNYHLKVKSLKKKRKDGRGQLTNIRFIEEVEHEKGTFG